MRRKVIAGNWKMYKNRDEAISFIYEVSSQVPSKDQVETVICAPAIFLRDLVKREGEDLRIGAQNMYFEDQGAYTGEISADMLTSYGVEYVVLGHSERRGLFFETDEMINKKTKQAIKKGITPIVCCGESLETREAGTTASFVSKQIIAAYEGITKEEALKIAVSKFDIEAISRLP